MAPLHALLLPTLLCAVQVISHKPPACWQPPYQSDTCCIRNDITNIDNQCQHPLTGTSRDDYLWPNRTTGDNAGFQDAFVRQGLYNSRMAPDCQTTWLGVTVRQPAQDLIIFQQLVYRLRPQLFVETGSYRGGLAYYISTLFHLLAETDARIITIDEAEIELREKAKCAAGGGEIARIKKDRRKVGQLRRDSIWKHYVRQLVGNSISPSVVQALHDEFRLVPKGAPVLITLDSDHKPLHVWAEIQLYAPFVSIGSYLVVQDAILGVTNNWNEGRAGPMWAAHQLIDASVDMRRKLGTFVWDRSVEVLGYTGHMYLKRTA